MPGEFPFRIAVAVVMLLTVSVTVMFRHQAAAPEDKINYASEGYAFAFLLRLAGLLLFLSTVSYVAVPTWVSWAAVPLANPVRWLAVVTSAAGCWLMYWTLSSLGKNLTNTVVTRQQATLVVSGPYHWVRHPFYVCAALLMASVSIAAANWLIAAGSLLVLILLWLRTPLEEKMLIAKFGQEYKQYMATTGRFIPRR